MKVPFIQHFIACLTEYYDSAFQVCKKILLVFNFISKLGQNVEVVILKRFWKYWCRWERIKHKLIHVSLLPESIYFTYIAI